MVNHYRIVYPDADDTTEADFGKRNLDKLKALGSFTLYPGEPSSVAEFIQRVGDAHAVILGWSIPDEVLVAAEHLQLISFTGIGASKFVNLELARQQGIIVCNCPGYGDQTVAEHALALTLGLTKNLSGHDQKLRQGIWDQSLMSFDIAGSTVGIIGFGGIGQQFAQICHGLGAKVLVWTRNPDQYAIAELPYRFIQLDQLLESADIVSVHIAHNRQTEHFLDSEKLARLKKGAYLINTARGEIVDESALCDLLHSGHLAGAGIDVFSIEPLEENNPLLSTPNTLLTPHVGFSSPGASQRLLDIAVQNIADFFSENPTNIVS